MEKPTPFTAVLSSKRNPNHFDKRWDVWSVREPGHWNVHIGVTLKGTNLSAINGLHYLYNDLSLKILWQWGKIWTLEGENHTRSVPQNLYGYRDQWSQEEVIDSIHYLQNRVQSYWRSLSPRILIVWVQDDVSNLLSWIASKDEYEQNIKFTDELSRYYQLNKKYLNSIWTEILVHLDDHVTQKDCGISSLWENIPRLKNIGDMFWSKEALMKRIEISVSEGKKKFA